MSTKSYFRKKSHGEIIPNTFYNLTEKKTMIDQIIRRIQTNNYSTI